MKSVPLVNPVSSGTNSIWTVQLCPGPKVAGQLLAETIKSSVAVTAPPRIAIAFWLVMVTAFGALVVPMACEPNASFTGLNTTPRPCPTRSTRSGLAGSLLTTLTAPGRLPEDDGVKVTLIVHVPPAAIDAPQVLEVA